MSRYLGFDSATVEDLLTLHAIKAEYPDLDFEYAQLDSGRWCVRTPPETQTTPALAATTPHLRGAVDRFLEFIRAAGSDNGDRES